MSVATIKPGTKLAAAVAWLRDYLRDCIAEGEHVYAAARDAGHSRRTIERACAVLGIAKTRTACTSYWERDPCEVLDESRDLYARLFANP